jgi:hypothetical protein
MSIINVNDVSKFVSGKTFEQVKSYYKDFRIKFHNNLYLLANNNKSNGNEENEENKENELNENIKKQANGIIFEMDTNKIVAMCYPQIDDINTKEQLDDLIKRDSTTIEFCEDGTIIRLYNYNDIWYTSTTKCIDASMSYWSSSKSFNELFWELFNKKHLENLDKNSTYFFILLHKENRMVIKHKNNSLIYISRIDNKTSIEDNTFIFSDNANIKKKEYIDKNEFMSIIESNRPFDLSNKRGVIIRSTLPSNELFVKGTLPSNELFVKGTLPSNELFVKGTLPSNNINCNYKIDFESYKIIKDIRGNVPEIRMRYIELLNKPESLELLEKIYKEYQLTFAFIKASILKLVKTIHRLYIKSHVKHQIEVKEDHIYYRTLRQLHAQYKTTSKPIQFEDVYNKIINLDKHIIKRFINMV